MREKSVQRTLIYGIEACGGLARKVQYVGRRSCPDVLFGMPGRGGMEGRRGLIEVKKAGEKPTPDQYREHDRLQAVGFRVYVLFGIDDVAVFLADLRDGSPR